MKAKIGDLWTHWHLTQHCSHFIQTPLHVLRTLSFLLGVVQQGSWWVNASGLDGHLIHEGGGVPPLVKMLMHGRAAGALGWAMLGLCCLQPE